MIRFLSLLNTANFHTSPIVIAPYTLCSGWRLFHTDQRNQFNRQLIESDQDLRVLPPQSLIPEQRE